MALLSNYSALSQIPAKCKLQSADNYFNKATVPTLIATDEPSTSNAT